MNSGFKVIGLGVIALLAVFATDKADASVVLADNEIIADGGAVFVRFDGSQAGHTSEVVLVNTGQVVFNNQIATAGQFFSIGTFNIGERLIFQINNLTTGFTFGVNAADSDDGLAHAQLSQDAPGAVQVGFEDLAGLGDRDFNDVTFTVLSEAALETPIPAAAPLLISGLAGLAFAGRRRKSRAIA